MKVCVNCRREMVCTKTGALALFGEAHGYPGDRFTCPTCKASVLVCNTVPIYTPGPRDKRLEVVTVNEGPINNSPPEGNRITVALDCIVAALRCLDEHAPGLSHEHLLLAQKQLQDYKNL